MTAFLKHFIKRWLKRTIVGLLVAKSVRIIYKYIERKQALRDMEYRERQRTLNEQKAKNNYSESFSKYLREDTF